MPLQKYGLACDDDGQAGASVQETDGTSVQEADVVRSTARVPSDAVAAKHHPALCCLQDEGSCTEDGSSMCEDEGSITEEDEGRVRWLHYPAAHTAPRLPP